MVKILSGIIICLIAYFIFLYCSNSSCAFLHDVKKKTSITLDTFKKIYSKLKFKSINFIWLRLIYFSSRIKVKFCCCILSSTVTNSLRILLLIPPSLFTRWRVIGKSQQYQLDNVKATTNAYRIRHYLLKTFFKNRTIAEMFDSG